MRQYLLSVYQPYGDPPPPEVLAPIMADLGALAEAMRADGPFTEGKEHVGGFTIINAPDLDAALVWGARMACASTLPVEVRAVA
jgi:hypothetical protein